MTGSETVEIYTDGACSGNPGPGGWAALLRLGVHEKELWGGEVNTTNNRMELMAAIMGLEALTRPCSVVVYTDSQYVQRGMTEWISGWKSKSWKQKNLKNIDLWQRLDQAANYHRVQWKWVKGHAGNPDNERVDKLAVAAIPQIK